MITQGELDKIHSLNPSDIKQILDECIEALCVVGVSDAMQILNISRSRVYQLMKTDNTLMIGNHKFLILNNKG